MTQSSQPANPMRFFTPNISAVVVFMSLLLLLYYYLFDFLRPLEFDTPYYVAASRLLFSLPGGFEDQARISKPLALILPGLMEKLFSIHPLKTLTAINFLSAILCGVILYKIVFFLTQKEVISFLAVFMFASTQPFAVYCLMGNTDIQGWFCGLVLIFLHLTRSDHTKGKIGYSLLFGVITGVCCLIKENALIGALYFSFGYFISAKQSIPKALKHVVVMGCGILSMLILSQGIIYALYHTSIVHRIWKQNTSFSELGFDLHYLQQVLRTFDLYWIFVAAGIWTYFKNRSNIIPKKILEISILTLCFILIMIPFFKVFTVDRIIFISGIALVLIALEGVKTISDRMAFLIIPAGIMNILLSFLIYRYEIHGLIAISFMLYAVFVFFLIKSNQKKSVKENHAY